MKNVLVVMIESLFVNVSKKNEFWYALCMCFMPRCFCSLSSLNKYGTDWFYVEETCLAFHDMLKFLTASISFQPVASILGIPMDHIFANQLLFGSSGEFLGFDSTEPTSRSGGKTIAVQQLRKVCHISQKADFLVLICEFRLTWNDFSGKWIQIFSHDWRRCN